MHSPILFTMALMFWSTIADLHISAWCVDFKQEGYIKSSPWNDAATQAACAGYKNRNTGRDQWDTCPDCSYEKIVNTSNYICWSNEKHIDGNEFSSRRRELRGSRSHFEELEGKMFYR
ncbi:hypothetical protein EAE96_010513 [Botrytis aclada]|nr:hypothetical protein EAE96_010513 [Botrytis aclada]